MKLAIYDAAENSPIGWSWAAGARLYKASGLFQHVVAARSWTQGLQDAVALARKYRFDEVQFWGHGRPGRISVDGESLKVNHDHRRLLVNLGFALEPDALLWFRVCSAFAGAPGHRLAIDLMKTTQRRVASSTFIIGFPWHSGQRSLRPGESPTWSLTEGLAADGELLPSRANAPHTLPFTATRLPSGW